MLILATWRRATAAYWIFRGVVVVVAAAAAVLLLLLLLLLGDYNLLTDGF